MCVRAVRVTQARTADTFSFFRSVTRSCVIDCSFAHQVTYCDQLTSLVGLESVTTLHTFKVCLRARARAFASAYAG